MNEMRHGLAKLARISAAVLLGTAGCRSAQDYRREADATSRAYLSACQAEVTGKVEEFEIETPADTLVRHIRRLTGWMDNNPRVLCGVHIPQLNAVYFGLDTAQFAVLQPPPYAAFMAQGDAAFEGGAVNG